MDMSTSCSPMQLQDASSLFFDCQDLLKQAYDPSSDPGYFSCCSSLSPTSSVDSFCFSPNSLSYGGTGQEPLGCFIFSSPVSEVKEKPSPLPETCTRKTRSRYPGKKRQTASEREKLRMRDLTKALHHLRSYLPASVVPAGQTLTKIETLRLTIRYISFLSAQLGLSEDSLCQGNTGAGTQNQTQNQTQTQNQNQTQSQNQGQTQSQGQTQTQNQSYSSSGYFTPEPCYDAMEAVDDSFSHQQSSSTPDFNTLPQSYQIPRNAYYPQTTVQNHWEPQQQNQQFLFSGLC